MLTINVIHRDGEKFLNGSINGEKFNLPYSDFLAGELEFKQAVYDSFTDGSQVEEWEKEVKELLTDKKEDVIETACPDLKKDPRTGKYYVVVEDEVSKTPVPEKLVAVILESVEKQISPTPIVKAWIRFLRDLNFYPEKGELFADYITATIIDYDEVERLVEEEGFTTDKALSRSEYNDVCITVEGLISCRKYAKLITEGWEIDPETNEAIRVSLFPKTPKTVDKITGKVEGNEIVMPEYAEELYFRPAVMGDGGDAFFCGDVEGHVIQVGKVHKLDSWDKVDTTDCRSCLKGLHVGKQICRLVA